jgi:peptide chain release factor subunit 1
MDDIQIWKIRKLIKFLRNAKGSGTSMVSLIIPTGGNIQKTKQMLVGEYGTAGNIKSRVNRLSVLSAITSAQNKLKMYSNKLPKNGLVLYCGIILTEEGKEKKVSFDFEPFKPINETLYYCDNKFHVEPLQVLLESTEVYGFIIFDGNGVLLATLNGNIYEVVAKFNIDIMTKTRRGGQSALRFARLREEQIREYIKKTLELAYKCFVTNNAVNVKGIILAGNGNIKHQLKSYDEDNRRVISNTIKNVLDIGYGGLNGLNHAIKLSADFLSNVKLHDEIKLLTDYFDNINKDTKLVSYGIRETLYCLEISAVNKLIIWEDLETIRYEVLDILSQTTKILYKNPLASANLEITKKELLSEWLVQNYKQYGAEIVFVSNKSQDGSQFCEGFGGLGAVLRYQVDMKNIDCLEDDDDNNDDDDW